MIEKMDCVLGMPLQFNGITCFRFASLQRETRVREGVLGHDGTATLHPARLAVQIAH